LETRWFVRSIAWRIAPLRLIHFLVPMGPAGADPLFFLSNARATGTFRWQDSMELAGSIASFVLVDTQVPTDEIEEEAMAVIEPQLIEKSVFVGPEDGPVLERIAARLGIPLPALRVASAQQAARWMSELRWESLHKDRVQRGSAAERILIATRKKVQRRTTDICGGLRQRLAESPMLTAEDVLNHIRKCSLCRLDPRQATMTNLYSEQKIDPSEFPATVTLGLESFMDWGLFREIATDSETDLIIIVANSPGARHPRWCLDVAKLFALDLQLGLVIEKDAIEPITYDPVVAVRRKLVENWEPQPHLFHLADVARALAPYVTAAGYKVRYESLIELPRGVSTSTAGGS